MGFTEHFDGRFDGFEAIGDLEECPPIDEAVGEQGLALVFAVRGVEAEKGSDQ